MRNTYSVLSILIMGLVISSSGLKAQQIGIQNSNKDPANPTSICQCDTLGKSPGTTDVTYLLGGNFSSSTEFHYELASPSNNWLTADSLDLIDHSPSGSIVDTFGSGFKDVQLAIPCDAPLGPATLRVRNSNGEISDTIFYIINKIPSPPKIDTIIGGFPNPYTTGVDDWGFCAGDSVALVAETQLGASYQWYLNGAPITGATSDTVYIFNSGAYSLQVDLGACDRFSKDTIINTFLPPVSISLSSSPPVAFQIDNPIPTNVSPDDSVQFCATETVLLQANAPGAGVNVNFSYQWLTDSVTQFGDRIYYKTDTADTLQTVNIDSTNIENPSEQRFYVVIDDGFCRDTSEVYYLYMDTIPRTRIINRNYSQGVLGPQMFGADVCMKDSVILRSEMTGGNWEFQWQRLNTSTNVWQSLPNAVNPGFDGTTRSIQVDTSIKPIQALSFYRLRTSTVTPQGDAVCTFITDSIRVRWFPEYDITFQPDPWVQNVGQDSINFCETDSATIIAPVTPSQLISNSLFYDYQWLRDTLDTTGAFVPAPIPGATARTLQVKEGGRYYVVIDDGICLDTSDVYRVFVDSLPRTSVVPRPYPGGPQPDLNLCLTDSVLLSATDTVFPGWQYQWQYNFGSGWSTMVGDTFPLISVDTAYAPFGGDDTVYFRLRVEYENQFGNTICPNITDSVAVIFFNPPNLSFFPGDTVTLCDGDSALVIAQGNSQSYSWDGGTVLGPQNYLKTAGVHTVTGTGTNGCTTTREVFARLFDTQADAGPDVTTTSGTTVSLSGSGGTSYRWYANKPIAWSDFLSQNVDVSYNLPSGVRNDTVTIFLEVTNSQGCVDTDSMLLIIGPGSDGDLSLIDQAWNLFTPNADGFNDVWDITGIIRDQGVCKVTVLNRWGSVVYEEDDFDGIWEGTNTGGAELPDGTYYYILSCDDEVLLKNAVTIVRTQ